MSTTIQEERTETVTPRASSANTGTGFVLKPYKYHAQPAHLEELVNDLDAELLRTKHGLSLGATATLRVLCFHAHTSQTSHPEWYLTVNPTYAEQSNIATVLGCGLRSVVTYMGDLDKAKFIRREPQFNRDGKRKADRVWVLFTDEDRKARKVPDYDRQVFEQEVSGLDFWDGIAARDRFNAERRESASGKKAPDNSYWVQPDGTHYKVSNPKYKPGPADKRVDLPPDAAKYLWKKHPRDRNRYAMDWEDRRAFMKKWLDPRTEYQWAGETGSRGRPTEWDDSSSKRASRRR